MVIFLRGELGRVYPWEVAFVGRVDTSESFLYMDFSRACNVKDESTFLLSHRIALLDYINQREML